MTRARGGNRGRSRVQTTEVIVRNLLEASEYHLADCRFRNLSPATITAYETYEGAFLTWLKEQGKPNTLPMLNRQNAKDAAEWVQHRHGGKRNGASAKKQFVAVLKTWSRFLAEEEITEVDWLGRLKRPQVSYTAQRPYEPWEIQALRGAFAQAPATAPRNQAMLALMLDTGVRISEIVNLEMRYLDMQGQQITVTGKGDRQRSLRFGSDERGGGKTTRFLRDYLKSRPRDADPAWVFINYHGEPLTTRAFRQAFVKAAKAAGITDAHPHRTRHTFATFWLVREWIKARDGRGIVLLRRLLGHLSKETYEVYTAFAAEIIEAREGGPSLADEWMEDDPKKIERRRLRAIEGGKALGLNTKQPGSGNLSGHPSRAAKSR